MSNRGSTSTSSRRGRSGARAGRGTPNRTATVDTRGNHPPPAQGPVPEIDTCCECKTTFHDPNDKMLVCEICQDSLICIDCLHIKDDAYDYVSTRPDLMWVCPYCKKAKDLAARFLQPAITQSLETLTNEFQKVNTRVQAVEEALVNKVDTKDLSAMNTNIKDLMARCDGYNKDVAAIDKKVNLLSSEPTEREKRKNNVVIKGVPEGNEIQTDLEICNMLLESLDIPDHALNINRLGRVRIDGSGRPLRVSLEDESARKRVLAAAKSLREFDSTDLPYDPQNIFIGPDLTILQREQAFSQREKQRERHKRQERLSQSLPRAEAQGDAPPT